jgi:hypothetical protein
VPEPTTVWFVRAGSVDGPPGRIALEGGDLVFTPHGEPEAAVRLPLVRIHDVRRLRGSPVLQVEATEQPPLLFYFAKPPPLPGSGERSVINPRRGMERTAAAMSLRAAARAQRALIDEWVGAIRAAREG